MAEFPPNLGDGEVWVPSNILPNKRFYPEFPSELTYMEELAHQLSAYALLERRSQIKAKPSPLPPPNPNLLLPNLEMIRQPNRYVSIAHHQPSLGLGLAGGGGGGGCHHHLHHHHDVYVSSGNGGSQFGSRPVYRYPSSKPAETQVGNIVQARARATILQRQQQMQNHSQNRFLPFQVTRSWMGGGGFGRESGGTGVFLPRVSTTTDAAARRKQSMRNGDETKHRGGGGGGGGGPVKKVGVGMQDQVSAEMGLPSDWTY